MKIIEDKLKKEIKEKKYVRALIITLIIYIYIYIYIYI